MIGNSMKNETNVVRTEFDPASLRESLHPFHFAQYTNVCTTRPVEHTGPTCISTSRVDHEPIRIVDHPSQVTRIVAVEYLYHGS